MINDFNTDLEKPFARTTCAKHPVVGATEGVVGAFEMMPELRVVKKLVSEKKTF